MNTRDRIVAQTTERILGELADPQAIAHARDDAWKYVLWSTLEATGLTVAWVPEGQGGAGVSLAEGFDIASAAGAFALGVPLAETLLAGWLLSRSGLASPAGAMTVAPFQPTDRITVDAEGLLRGCARAIAFARSAEHVAVHAESRNGPVIMRVNLEECRLFHATSLAGDPQDDIFFDGVRPIEAAPADEGVDQRMLMLMGCTVRALQIAGALQSVLVRTIAYAGERIAFGRPIGKFQAVQTNVARLAGEVAAATAAADSAADTIAHASVWDEEVFLEVTAAKIRCAEAANVGAALAHQIHGAIGLTVEHVLHRFTLRMLGWSEDFGNDSYWAVALGQRIAQRGGDMLWPLLASR